MKTLRYEKVRGPFVLNLSRAPRWRTDRAKPQQDVHQLYRIAAGVQSQRVKAQIKSKWDLPDYRDVAGKRCVLATTKINGIATMSSTKANTAQLHGFPKFNV